MSALFVPSSEPRTLEDLIGQDHENDETQPDVMIVPAPWENDDTDPDPRFLELDPDSTRVFEPGDEDPGVPFDGPWDRMMTLRLRQERRESRGELAMFARANLEGVYSPGAYWPGVNDR